MQEVWKDLPDYEGLYQVSNLGRVKSFKRKEITILKGIKEKQGYITFNLTDLNGKSKRIKAHQLVAITFLNHKPCGMKLVIDHINDIKNDNRLENLKIVTNRQNCYKTKNNKSSIYKGVSWFASKQKWFSRIYINGKVKCLGYYKTEIEAHKSYLNALKQINEVIYP
jgi:hypothetical protein